MATMSLQAAYDQARSYLEANKVEQAIGVAQHILEQFPENLEAHRILGEAYLAGRQFDQAEAAFSRVLHADPENIPAHVGLGITYERQGKLDRAVAEFEQALEVRPDMPELRSQLLRLYADIYGSEGATLRLSRPGLARLYAKGHMLPQAIQEFRSVIEEMPERFDARVGLAEALWRDGQEQAAVEVCEEILAERSDVLKANLLLGYIKLANSDESGEPYWRLAQQLDPYQTVARALFETLPDLPGPELNLPAWDEEAWAARRAEQERSTAQLPAVEEQDEALPLLDEQDAVPAAASADDLFSASWLDEPDETPPPSRQAARSSRISDDDDFLATLLALDTPPLPTEEGSDLDSTSGITPFSLDDLTAEAPSSAEARPAADELEPFSLEELGLGDDEIAALGASTPSAEQQDQGAEQIAPLSLQELGLSDEEIAQLEGGSQGEQAQPEPSSAADLGLADETAPAAEAQGDESELEPFSLEDLGLSPEEIDQLNAVAPASEESAPAAEQPASEEQPAAAEPELTPFSLEDLGLSPEEIDQLNAVAPASEEQPIAAEQPASEEQPAAAEPELEPFSLEDLGLSPEEIDQLNAVAPASEEQPAAAEQPASEEQPAELELTPFSLEDLGLSPEEIAQLEAATPSEEAAPAAGDELAGLEPFDWGSIEAPAESQDEARSLSSPQEVEGDVDLSELTPFSLDDLDLEAPGDDASTLPPSLQPFSLDESMGGNLPAIEPEETDETGGYSWQQPSAKPRTDFGSEEEPDSGRGSIFGRMRQAAAERPVEEPPPLPPVSDDEAEAAGYFSNDDVSLRPDITSGSHEEAQPERLVGTFRLPKEEPEPEQPAEPAAAADELEPAEPELTPFSLEDLGLSPEEIAQLEAAQGGQPAAEAQAEQPAAEAQAGQPSAETTEEPELTPFSLEDLGLSPEEIAQLNAASTADEEALPATGETIVPGWSRGEEPELTPFSPEDVEGEQPAADAEDLGPGVQPFSLDDLGLEEAASEDLGLDVQPFSLDDLGLDDVGGPPAEPSRELGLTAEELAGLDLGELESALSESAPPPPLAEDPDAAFERLMSLGQERGFVDLTDIIAVVSDPEAEADRIEEIGWALHRAGIQIRDGDEVIDMEEGEVEEVVGEAEEAQPAAPEAAPVDAEPDLTPFSLEELGLTPEEIAALGLGDATSAQPEATPSAPAEMTEEPELTPFSLEDLGLSPEEIAQLEAAQTEQPAAEAQAEQPAADTDDMFDFGIADATPVEKVTKRTEPRAEEPPPAVDPADAAFVAEPLDNLDDIWQTPPPPPAEEPARVVLPPMSERPAARRGAQDEARPPRAPAAPREAPPARPTSWTREDGSGRRSSTRGRDDERYAKREQLAPRPVAPPPIAPKRFSDFLPTGDEGLDEYLRQLEEEPGNYVLAMAIGRLSAHTGRASLMSMAYKGLIKEGRGIDEIAEELEGLVGEVDDPDVQRQLYRLLGDTYSKQGRLREAMAAYGYTFGR